MSKAQIMWDNWDKHDNLDSVYREGFFKFHLYGYGHDADKLLDYYHAETTATHSYRTALLFSDIVDLHPSYYQDVDKYTALKVALDHDIGELIVGDVCNDGSKEHETKKHAERIAVDEHLFRYGEDNYLRYRRIYREFEDASTFLGQTIRLADRLDFIASLIKLGSQGCNLERREGLSDQDQDHAKEIKCYNVIDICANGLRHEMYEYHFDPRLVQIGEQFMTCGLATIHRPFFKWWHHYFKTEKSPFATIGL